MPDIPDIWQVFGMVLDGGVKWKRVHWPNVPCFLSPPSPPCLLSKPLSMVFPLETSVFLPFDCDRLSDLDHFAERWSDVEGLWPDAVPPEQLLFEERAENAPVDRVEPETATWTTLRPPWLVLFFLKSHQEGAGDDQVFFFAEDKFTNDVGEVHWEGSTVQSGICAINYYPIDVSCLPPHHRSPDLQSTTL